MSIDAMRWTLNLLALGGLVYLMWATSHPEIDDRFNDWLKRSKKR